MHVHALLVVCVLSWAVGPEVRGRPTRSTPPAQRVAAPFPTVSGKVQRQEKSHSFNRRWAVLFASIEARDPGSQSQRFRCGERLHAN
jgi:hypothetical protein